jgi:hypothetical protein
LFKRVEASFFNAEAVRADGDEWKRVLAPGICGGDTVLVPVKMRKDYARIRDYRALSVQHVAIDPSSCQLLRAHARKDS